MTAENVANAQHVCKVQCNRFEQPVRATQVVSSSTALMPQPEVERASPDGYNLTNFAVEYIEMYEDV